MHTAPFVLYSASAGSGKTYKLVQEYLKRCLHSEDPSGFQQILAITFTNKAANEMKNRVVEALWEFGREEPSAKMKGLRSQVADDLQLSEPKLQQRAHKVLRKMLHNYSSLSISTIDKFSNRLIRSFSRDLQLSAHYTVELDQKKLLREAVEQMLENTTPGSPLARLLLIFVNQKLEEGKSPNIDRGITEKVGEFLWQEEAHELLKQLRTLETEQYLEIKAKMQREVAQFMEGLEHRAQFILHILEENEVPSELFQRNAQLDNILAKTIAKPELLTKRVTLLKIMSGESNFYAKKNEGKAAPLLDPITPELVDELWNLERYLEDNLPRYEILQKILRHIDSLAVVTEVEQNLEAIKEETNTLPIGEFNKIISEQLRSQPAPFLYEKLGERYRHYFIDEFQDTSRMQWHNLVPLINNALAEENTSAMLVGDAKQSIYRWRGGDVEQFLSITTGDDNTNKVEANGRKLELYSRKVETLNHNWRSRRNVVEFNNNFFRHIAQKLPNDLHAELYQAAAQNPKGQEGGYVELRLFEAKNTIDREAPDEHLIKVIRDALERDFRYGDICILLRKKANAREVAELLREAEIPFVGNDSLQLGQSPQVKAILALLYSLYYPDNKIDRIDFLELLASELEITPKEEKQFYERHSHCSIRELLDFFQQERPKFRAEAFRSADTLAQIQMLITALEQLDRNDLFIQKLLDETHALQKKNGPHLSPFLEWWQDEGKALSLDFPQDTNAVRIDTIHSTKGLEFPITIVAYCDWMIFQARTTAWMDLSEDEFYGLPASFLDVSSKYEELHYEPYAQLCERIYNLTLLDEMNLLYVAFTRAVDELYVLGSTLKHNSSNRIWTYLQSYIQHEGYEEVFYQGTKVEKSTSEPVRQVANLHPQDLVIHQHTEHLKISVNAPKDWHRSDAAAFGQKIHYVMSLVEQSGDVDHTLEQLANEGMLQPEERKTLESTLRDLIARPELQRYFSGEMQTLNERDILLPGRGVQRPDRVMLEGEQVHVLDYKTGEPREEHRRQLDDYMRSLTSMGFDEGQKLLVYIDEAIRVEVW